MNMKLSVLVVHPRGARRAALPTRQALIKMVLADAGAPEKLKVALGVKLKTITTRLEARPLRLRSR